MKDTKLQVYNYLNYAFKGEENGVQAREVAERLHIPKRSLRLYCNLINADSELGIVSTSDKIYVCNTENECKRAINNTFKQAFTLLRKARAMQKKLGLQNQIEFKDGKETVKIIFEDKE